MVFWIQVELVPKCNWDFDGTCSLCKQLLQDLEGHTFDPLHTIEITLWVVQPQH